MGNLGIGDEGVKLISSCLKKKSVSLKELGLEQNKIGVEGIKELSENLKINKSITELDLRNNQIGDEGAKVLAEMLSYNNSIKYLCLMNNKMTDKGAQYLLESIKNSNNTLERLEFRFNNVKDSTLSANLKKMVSKNSEISPFNLNIKRKMLILQKRKDGNIVSSLPRRVLIYLLAFLDFLPKD